MKTMVKKLLGIIIILALVISCAGCGIKDRITRKTKDDAGHSTELSIYSHKPDTFCPIAGSNEANLRMLEIVYDGLVELTEKMTALPSLAADWSASADGLEWIVNLKKSTLWHDGSEPTAKDVVYTVEQIKKIENSPYKYNVSNIDTITQVNDYTVDIRLFVPKANFINLLYFPIIKAGAEELDLVNFKPIGTGPYMFEDRNEGNVYYLVRNPKWWGGTAKTETIKVKMLPSGDTALYAFGSGTLDLTPADNMDWGKFVDPTASMYTTVETPVYNFLGINHAHKSLAMYELRRAISLAIDRKEVVDEARMGYADVANTPVRAGWFICENQEFERKQDFRSAKKILEESGWIFEGNEYKKTVDGVEHRASFSIMINEENTVRENIARIISQNLEEFGIRVDIIRVSFDEYSKRIAEGNYDAFVGSMALSPDMDFSTFVGEGNVYCFYDEEMQFVMNEVSKKTNEEEVKAKYAEFINLFEQLNPVVGLFFENSVVVYTKQIESEINPLYFDVYNGIENIQKGEAK